MSVGGVLGGLFCAIIAPTLFDWTYEHPLLILAAAFLLPQAPLVGPLRRLWGDPGRSRPLELAIVLVAFLIAIGFGQHLFLQVPGWMSAGAMIAIGLLALISLGQPLVFAACLAALMLSYGGWSTLKLSAGDNRTRSYFGVYTITDRRADGTRALVHGTTLHGLQSLRPGQETQPTSYYGFSSGVGLAMAGAPVLFGDEARIGVVGLGTGTLACYARPGQDWRFFEIDPAVVKIATDPERFSFLSRCRPDARIVLGDARLSLAREQPGRLNILAVDAFSSDAVPMHLLTRQAMEIYGQALHEDGLLLIHISNRYLDLRPVLAANASSAGWHSAILTDEISGSSRDNYTSIWVAMSRDPGTILLLKIVSGKRAREWRALPEKPGFTAWTDDYASTLPLMKSWLPK
jgi:spermidine synthase